jgi:hypothetical protein
LFAVFAAGCSKSPESKPTTSSANDAKSAAPIAEHTHGAGPNGGIVFDLGSHHAEFTVDHNKKECMILVLGDDEKTPTPVATTEFVLLTKETKTAEGKPVAPMTIMMKPTDAADGKAKTYVGTGPGLGNVADFAGTVSGEIDGKPSQGEFKE